ncbi:hypothetical protein AB6806_11010 [Bosea sp. RCC_152_1]|uniref:hypothetical protein n=1 Tax=Bosea sp. RCC_152_1 TaxID=3239228 RepID=UPI003525711C
MSQVSAEVTVDPDWREIEDAIRALDDERFMVLLSARTDLDCSVDPDALAVTFQPGFGFSLFQAAFVSDHSPAIWRTRSAARCLGQSEVDLDLALLLAQTFSETASFGDLDRVYADRAL